MFESFKSALGDRDEARGLGIDIDARTAMLMACSQDCVKLLSPDGTMRYMSRNGRCVMEVDNLSRILGQKWWALWPDNARELLEEAVAQAATGRIASFVAECPTASGREACWSVSVSGVPDETGKIVELLSVSALTEEPVRKLVVE